jgi:deoxyribodipyrimidine photo-lyase
MSAFKKHGSVIKNQKELAYMKRILITENTNLMVNGGRINGLKQLKQSAQTQKHYPNTRNVFAVNTSQLSAYIKFGCVSVREVYRQFVHSFGIKSEIIRQLIWRDFYAHVLFGYPNYKSSLKSVRWSNNERHFDLWCKGMTGFPIVDASMRQLNSTGWMHNRGRLVVSSFLVKTLLIDWKWGEQYFANKLVDYDVASNNGNWQWISGSGVDSMPYYRVFNPWTQSEKYDPDAEYIKKWIPELKDVDPKIIHKWDVHKNTGVKIDYPAPIVDFSTQYHKMLERYS